MPTAHQQQTTSRAKRVALVRPCAYSMTEVLDQRKVLLHEGEGLSVNVGPGGMLLLIPQAPQPQQVFEVQVPSSRTRKAKKLALVEVRWTREIEVSGSRPLTFVGVRFLMNLSQPTARETLS